MMNALPLAVLPAVLVATVLASAQEAPAQAQTSKSLTVKKMTANLYTDDVAACVNFWVDRLHFEKTMEVPDGAGLAFASLQKGNIELMYGSYASLDKEPATSHAYQRGTSFLFLEVEDVEGIYEAMAGAPVVAPIHKTFYGSTEFSVKDPAGHLITFAQFGKP
jgi:uncharacterized glyoxalase superfamily protein PhnB